MLCKECNKEIGDDINEGKKTLLVIYAVNKLSESDASQLQEILHHYQQ